MWSRELEMRGGWRRHLLWGAVSTVQAEDRAWEVGLWTSLSTLTFRDWVEEKKATEEITS